MKKNIICDWLLSNVGCFDEHGKNLILELKYAGSPRIQKTLVNLSITWIDSLYGCMKLCAVLAITPRLGGGPSFVRAFSSLSDNF